jgi:1,4-dihydroxy-2-naphthoyl-CoA hydrolase
MPHPLLAPLDPTERQRLVEQTGGTGVAGRLGVKIEHSEPDLLRASMTLRDEHLMTASGLVHAGTVFAFADTCTGWACLLGLGDGVGGFTTIEGKINLTATAERGDRLIGEARLMHRGRTTEVWDATVVRERDDRVIAYYRCTQALLAVPRE